MSSERIASIDIVIDADGLRKTGQALQTMEKYMEKLKRRAEVFNRIRITPIIRLNDCLCVPLKAIRLKLLELTRMDWVINVRAKFSMSSRLLERIKSTVKAAVEVDVKVNVAASVMAEVGTIVAGSSGQSADPCKCKDGGKGGKDDGKSGGWKELTGKYLGKVLDAAINAVVEKAVGDAYDKVFKNKTKGDNPDADSPAKKAASKDNPAKRNKKNKKAQELSQDSTKRDAKNKKGRTVNPASDNKAMMDKKSSTGGKRNLFSRVVDRIKGTAKRSAEAIPEAAEKTKGKSGRLRNSASKMLSGAKTATQGFLPLSLAMGALNIATASPGKERNKAIGQSIGGGIGAVAGGALGTLLGPGIGTTIGAMAGGAVGSWIGGKAGEVAGKIKKLWPFGNKNKKKKALEAIPEPSETPSARQKGSVGPVMGTGMVAGAAASTIYSQTTMGIKSAQQPPAPAPTNVSIMNGAVQLSIQQNQKIDYDAISAQIGAQLAVSIRQSIENRA